MASDDFGFPAKLGQRVSRHAGGWMWRIEVREPDTMAAAWFTHENLSAILGTPTMPRLSESLCSSVVMRFKNASALRGWSIGLTRWVLGQSVAQ